MAIFGDDVVVDATAFVHPSAQLYGKVHVGAQASIWPHVVIRSEVHEVRIGARTNVQDACVLHVDDGVPLTIGSDVSIGHQVMLHGCTIQDGCLIGINAVVLSGARIGKNCLIGANSLVTEGKEIPDNSMVLGSPGKIVRELSDEAAADLRKTAEGYVARGAWYRAQFRPQGRGE